MHFRDRGGKVCFRTHPVIPLIITVRQNYFYQNFFLEKTFPIIFNKTHLPNWNFKVDPPSTGEGGRSSIFASADNFLKNIKYVFFYFSILDVFLKIICFLTHHVIPLIIIARQNYFYNNFCIEKIFPVIWNNFPIWNFKVVPHLLP